MARCCLWKVEVMIKNFLSANEIWLMELNKLNKTIMIDRGSQWLSIAKHPTNA